ncbi:ABC transporter ATP-binding protein [Achromobacter denitrificans]|uniref:ABC transporter ATP-binding protein n=1 Tax=Achromobacter denitrificans TaxID=32002 RepID=UPI0023E3F896|nr:ABC transporter ATP-binding protein [Achromobacter denitrificans]MBV2158057.1 ABC transporter ATP-binding protein [Achromobacter denitrificans]MDF3939985.1 ABC transporter ATP-binding protein [Achromobacter denitrificans]MDX3882007.1 ABC transporter ATP-binding protein [Achromobacter sp.]WFC70220.1 ABC transporter ATP-binding protein [Achromobacter denitrificans]
MTPTPPLLDIRGLSIRLPAGADRALAVKEASLSVAAGETLCIVGESGSGKSMIANAVMGLLPQPLVAPVAGAIAFQGQDLLALREPQWRALRGNRIGMIFQDPMSALNPVMRIGEQLEEALDAHLDLTPGDKRARILAALRDVRLPDPEGIAASYPGRLSGGQRQRVMIACALMLEPALLIADEPTTALDVTTQAQILELIRDLQARQGTAVLFITHDFGVVSQIADRVAVMQLGEIVEAGDAAAVLGNPQHDYTRKLISAIPHGMPAAGSAANAQPLLLDVRDLRKTYSSGGGLFRRERETAAMRGISFTLQRGEVLGLVGESGSGKSTLGRCIAGLLAPDGGQILFNGREHGARPAPGRVQMVFQDPQASLNPRHTVGRSIMAGPLAQGMAPERARERAAELLHLVGLNPDAARRYPHEFSGGQRQRIGIARALASEPELIVADEPVSALDVSVQAQVLELFASVRRQFHLSMLFVTHDLRVAAQMCDRIAVMQQGRIIECGSAAQVIRAPSQDYTRALVQAVPDFASIVSGRARLTGLARLEAAA